jgi:hypothetical protein
LSSGGFLIFSALGFGEIFCPSEADFARLSQTYQKDDPATFLPAGYHHFKNLGFVMQRTRQQFSLASTAENLALNLVPAVHRNPKDVLDAIQSSPELIDGFEIVHNHVHSLPDEFKQKYVSGEYSFDRYVYMTFKFIKAWSEFTIRTLLQENEAAIEWFYKELEKDIRERIDHWCFENCHLIVCLRKV